MRLRADFNAPVEVLRDEAEWVASPMPGVDRLMLDRVGDEVARATSLVRYAPGSRFSAHTHGGGEEFIVLEGVFSDASGDYPAGSYVRNPIGTSHAPHTDPGCVIFVKLQQFDRDDTAHFAVAIEDGDWDELAPGLSSRRLHAHGGEVVRAERWDAGIRRTLASAPDGEELLVLAGEIARDGAVFPRHSWLRRRDAGERTFATTGGALVWVKTGHLTESRLENWRKSA